MPSALTTGAVRLFYKLYLQKRDNPQTDNQYRRDQRTPAYFPVAKASDVIDPFRVVAQTLRIAGNSPGTPEFVTQALISRLGDLA